ncbi:MAG: ABC transporter permease [Cryomorphaceae bacterium]|nr:ABC transporter permease [Cryomorphaceae bacterium]
MKRNNFGFWFGNSVLFGLRALRTNRLRAVLSLIGITIGIYAIITVFAMVDSLKQNIRDSLNQLGNDVLYVQKWPWGTPGEYPWWKYANRPEVSVDDFLFLQRNLTGAQFVVFSQSLRKTVSYNKIEAQNTSIQFVSHDFLNMQKKTLAEGRYFSAFESVNGNAVAVLGADIANALFPNRSALGEDIRLMGKRVRVIGVFEQEGSSLISGSADGRVILPLNFGRGFINFTLMSGANIEVRPLPDVNVMQLSDEIRGRLRTHRRIGPTVDDNFSINEITLLQEGITSIFSVLTIAGILIGGFSILVGGFGIANIMFVSVKERTGQIGIQKALGAKNHFVLIQFLAESVFLCIIGGIVGLILVFLTITVADKAFELNMYLSAGNVVMGVVISVVIGIVSGLAPALSASAMRPVDAIRENF